LGWDFLASEQAGSATDLIDTGTIDAKNFLKIFVYTYLSGSALPQVQFNGITTTTYAWTGQQSFSGVATATGINSFYAYTDNQKPQYAEINVANLDGEYKMMTITSSSGGASEAASDIPAYRQGYAVWYATAQVTSVQLVNVESGSFNTGTMLTVFGSD
tara:strand:+ start:85 stop:561 length:477 start_codon:yes stop_codon:yes gene_type:complete